MYIAFEGIEGSGKSVQIKLLKEFFSSIKVDFIVTKEPGSTKIGEKIREILLSSEFKEISTLTELFLYFSDRAQHYKEIIKPNYRKKIIISDRSMYSTVAYQGYGRGIDLRLLNYLNDITTEKIYPDIVILLDCPVELGIKRALMREKDLKNARFELEDKDFHEKVRKGYLELAKLNNWIVVDSTFNEMEVFEKIKEFLMKNYEKDIRNFTKK